MAATRLQIRDGSLSHEQLRTVGDVLAGGGLVAFPTETVYGVGGRAGDPAVETRLRALKGERGDKPFAVLLAAVEHVYAHVRSVPPTALRLMRAGWPGPLTLVLPARSGTGTVGLRCPDHPIARAIAGLAPRGLASSSANRSGVEPPTTAAEVQRALGDVLDLIVDGGPARLGTASSVVRVDAAGRLEVLREGAFPRARAEALAYRQILLVCTGNTCRSPLAAALLRRRLARGLACTEAELPDRGFVVLSAGTSAFGGAPASDHAVTAARELGGDLAGHVSQPVTPVLVGESDLVCGMTQHHLEAIRDWVPEAAARVRLLVPGRDVPDPVGGTLAAYRSVAALLDRATEALAAELLAARPPGR